MIETSTLRVPVRLRIESHVLNVLKALAELHDRSPGALIEDALRHASDGKPGH